MKFTMLKKKIQRAEKKFKNNRCCAEEHSILEGYTTTTPSVVFPITQLASEIITGTTLKLIS